MESFTADDGIFVNQSSIRVSTPTNLDMFLIYASQFSELFSLVLLVVGCMCSPLSIAVLSRKPFRTTSISVYLRFVALCDTVALLTGLVSIYRLSVFGRDIYKDMNLCRLFYWTVSVSAECSSWTLIAVTVERVVSIVWPHKIKVMCSITVSKVTVLVIFLTIASILSFIPTLVGHETSVIPSTNTTFTRTCVLVAVTKDAILAKYILDVLAYALPFSILSTCNIIIIVSVVESRKRVLKFSKNSSQPIDDKVKEKRGAKNMNRKNVTTLRSKRESSLTITLMCINSSYIVCNLPVVAYQLSPAIQTRAGLSSFSYSVYTLLYLLMYCNNVVNFLLYFVTGSKFRNELRQMFEEIRMCNFGKYS